MMRIHMFSVICKLLCSYKSFPLHIPTLQIPTFLDEYRLKEGQVIQREALWALESTRFNPGYFW